MDLAANNIGVIPICSSRTPGSCASAPGVAKRPDFRADCLGQVRGLVQLVWNVSVCFCMFCIVLCLGFYVFFFGLC